MTQQTQRTVWDYIADLMSGRVQNTLQTLHRGQLALVAQIKEIQKTMADKTANEQAILNAAQKISDAADAFTSGIQALKDKLAEANVPREDVSDELGALEAATAKLQGVADSLGSVEANPIPDVSGPGITAPADPSPLAGESGTTNPVTEDGGPMITQQAPGVPVAEKPAEEEAAPAADAPVEGEGLWAGENNEQVNGDDTGSAGGPFDPPADTSPAPPKEGGPFDPQ